MSEIIISSGVGEFLSRNLALGGSKFSKMVKVAYPFLENVHVGDHYICATNSFAIYGISKDTTNDSAMSHLPSGEYSIEKISGGYKLTRTGSKVIGIDGVLELQKPLPKRTLSNWPAIGLTAGQSLGRNEMTTLLYPASSDEVGFGGFVPSFNMKSNNFHKVNPEYMVTAMEFMDQKEMKIALPVNNRLPIHLVDGQFIASIMQMGDRQGDRRIVERLSDNDIEEGAVLEE